MNFRVQLNNIGPPKEPSHHWLGTRLVSNVKPAFQIASVRQQKEPPLHISELSPLIKRDNFTIDYSVVWKPVQGFADRLISPGEVFVVS
jgi:hypothetical protein